MAGYETKLEDAKSKENELKSKIKKLKDERDAVNEKLESASTNASGTANKSLKLLFY